MKCNKKNCFAGLRINGSERLRFVQIFILFFALLKMPLSAQTQTSSAWLNQKFGTFISSDEQLSQDVWFAAKRADMQLAPASEMQLDEVIEGSQSGMTHYKYKQYHAGLPVYGCTYVLHEDQGFITHATGRFAPNINKTKTEPTVPANIAIALAKQKMGAAIYRESKKSPVLCWIDPTYPKESGTVRLAWMVDIASETPMAKRRFFIDALLGTVLANWSLIHETGVPSTAKTRYYGTKTIVTDSLSAQSFILRDPTRGQGITVQNGEQKSNFFSTTRHWDLTNPEQDEVALDAHYCTQEYYDMMLNTYQWHGLDGQGGALKVLIHQNQLSSVNAYWDGEYTNYGDGDCLNGPLTTLEVVGHEFTHGMIDYTSELDYTSESGAINESLADMFGKLLEQRTEPAHFSWVLGHSFALSPSTVPFRVMDNPKSRNMPAFYNGEFWLDDGGVHTNSSIGNLWFVMICDGRQGVNEAGQSFDVSGIGFEKAGQIVFETNRAYLTSSSDYRAFANYSQLVALQKYGQNSPELLAVQEAWKAVGVSALPSNQVDLKVITSFWDTPTSCELNAFFPIKIKIENKSSVPYVPTASNTAQLVLTEFSMPDKIVPIQVPIPAGAVIEVQVDDWIYVTSSNYYQVELFLDYNDAVASNNLGSQGFLALDQPTLDLALNSVWSMESGCFEDSISVHVTCTNSSCDTLPAGATIVIELKDENNSLIGTLAETTSANIEPNVSFFIEGKIPIGPSEITANLILAADTNPGNNQATSAPLEYRKVITGNYFNSFVTDPSTDEYLSIQNFAADNRLFYQGSQMLATTGVLDDTSYFQKCPNPLDVVDDITSLGYSMLVQTCLDLSGSIAPSLDFDLVQFQNNVVAQSSPYTSMAVVRWKGTSNGQEVIYGQPEGVKQHKTYPLPPNFKGALNLNLYTEIGTPYIFSSSDLNIHDWQLVDNLQISTITAVEDLSPSFDLKMTPNPAHALVQLQCETPITQIEIVKMDGQLVRAISGEIRQLDIHDLPDGVYLLRAHLDDNRQALEKLVVLRP